MGGGGRVITWYYIAEPAQKSYKSENYGPAQNSGFGFHMQLDAATDHAH